jgi:hypothetical protein
MQVSSASAASAGRAWRRPPSANVKQPRGSGHERLALNAVPAVDTGGRKQAMTLMSPRKPQLGQLSWLIHGM